MARARPPALPSLTRAAAARLCSTRSLTRLLFNGRTRGDSGDLSMTDRAKHEVRAGGGVRSEEKKSEEALPIHQ